LLIVDLAQIENGSLHRFARSNALVFYNAEVAMILAVFFAMDAAQKHADSRLPELWPRRKTLGLHSTVFSPRGDGNTRLNRGNYGKNIENPLQLVKLG
jgi:hypothetical protein